MQQRIKCGHRKPDGFSFPGINPHLGHLTRRHFLYRLQYRSRGKGCQPVFQAETRFFYAFYGVWHIGILHGVQFLVAVSYSPPLSDYKAIVGKKPLFGMPGGSPETNNFQRFGFCGKIGVSECKQPLEKGQRYERNRNRRRRFGNGGGHHGSPGRRPSDHF